MLKRLDFYGVLFQSASFEGVPECDEPDSAACEEFVSLGHCLAVGGRHIIGFRGECVGGDCAGVDEVVPKLTRTRDYRVGDAVANEWVARACHCANLRLNVVGCVEFVGPFNNHLLVMLGANGRSLIGEWFAAHPDDVRLSIGLTEATENFDEPRGLFWELGKVDDRVRVGADCVDNGEDHRGEVVTCISRGRWADKVKVTNQFHEWAAVTVLHAYGCMCGFVCECRGDVYGIGDRGGDKDFVSLVGAKRWCEALTNGGSFSARASTGEGPSASYVKLVGEWRAVVLEGGCESREDVIQPGFAGMVRIIHGMNSSIRLNGCQGSGFGIIESGVYAEGELQADGFADAVKGGAGVGAEGERVNEVSIAVELLVYVDRVVRVGFHGLPPGEAVAVVVDEPSEDWHVPVKADLVSDAAADTVDAVHVVPPVQFASPDTRVFSAHRSGSQITSETIRGRRPFSKENVSGDFTGTECVLFFACIGSRNLTGRSGLRLDPLPWSSYGGV